MSPIWSGEIAGSYVLTGAGELGVYDMKQVFHVDSAMTAAFLQSNRNFVRSYLKNPDPRYRLGIVYGAPDRKPNDPLTMLFEEAVVRQLYPVGGPVNQGLTTFQKKNRHKRAYQGLELLTGHRRDAGQGALRYCPVLFDRHTTLNAYDSSLGRPLTEDDAGTPVIEVINLVATIPPSQHVTSEVAALRERVIRSIVRDDALPPPTASLTLARRGEHWEPEAPAGEAYAEIARDRRRDRGITLSAEQLERLHQTESFEQIECWLEVPHRPVDGAMLRRFVQFRNLDEAALAQLAGRTLVYTAPAGARLINLGQADAWNLYLLKGAVSLQARDGATHFVEGNTGNAAFPVSFLKPRKYNVAAITPVSFLWVHDILLESAAEHRVDRKMRLGPVPG